MLKHPNFLKIRKKHFQHLLYVGDIGKQAIIKDFEINQWIIRGVYTIHQMRKKIVGVCLSSIRIFVATPSCLWVKMRKSYINSFIFHMPTDAIYNGNKRYNSLCNESAILVVSWKYMSFLFLEIFTFFYGNVIESNHRYKNFFEYSLFVKISQCRLLIWWGVWNIFCNNSLLFVNMPSTTRSLNSSNWHITMYTGLCSSIIFREKNDLLYEILLFVLDRKLNILLLISIGKFG